MVRLASLALLAALAVPDLGDRLVDLQGIFGALAGAVMGACLASKYPTEGREAARRDALDLLLTPREHDAMAETEGELASLAQALFARRREDALREYVNSGLIRHYYRPIRDGEIRRRLALVTGFGLTVLQTPESVGAFPANALMTAIDDARAAIKARRTDAPLTDSEFPRIAMSSNELIAVRDDQDRYDRLNARLARLS